VTLHARIPAAEINRTSPLYRDFIAGGRSPLGDSLPAFSGAFRDAHGIPPAHPMSGALVEALVSYNQSLGVDAALVARLGRLRDGALRLIVTGQQPGVMGGPLMTLYKAASAIALAEEIEARTGHACAPLFWLGSDDDDFSEARDLSVIAADHSRLDASLDASVYRPGLRVGDIDVAAARAVWRVVEHALPQTGHARDRLAATLDGAADFGLAAARALVAATAGKIVIVDARAPELRIAGRELLLRFFDDEPKLRELLEKSGRELEAHGYHAQVQWGADSGLFRVENGVRQRVSAGHRAAVRAEFERDITRASPAVVARNLLQDAVLAPLAVVLGPAEIAYRAQMAGVYREMAVPMPVVCPRLSATFLPPAVRDMVNDLHLDAAELARDPASVAASVANRSADGGLKSAAAALQSEFESASRAFLGRAVLRLDERAQRKLQKRIDELKGRLEQTLATAIEHDTDGYRARWPFLPRTTDMFRKDADPQERFLSLVVPMLFHGDDAWRCVSDMSAQWSRDALDGRVWHGVYSA